MLIAGLMACTGWEYEKEMIADFSKHVDYLVLRFDLNELEKNKSIRRGACLAYMDYMNECCECSKWADHTKHFTSWSKWNRWNWRNELIRTLDEVKPHYVVFIDNDEGLPINFTPDFLRFVDSNKAMMFFDYRMGTIEGRHVEKYPKVRHCKAFKWVPGLNYLDYKGYAQPSFPASMNITYYNKPDKRSVYLAQHPITHYCFYTKELEEQKILHP